MRRCSLLIACLVLISVGLFAAPGIAKMLRTTPDRSIVISDAQVVRINLHAALGGTMLLPDGTRLTLARGVLPHDALVELTAAPTALYELADPDYRPLAQSVIISMRDVDRRYAFSQAADAASPSGTFTIALPSATMPLDAGETETLVYLSSPHGEQIGHDFLETTDNLLVASFGRSQLTGRDVIVTVWFRKQASQRRTGFVFFHRA